MTHKFIEYFGMSSIILGTAYYVEVIFEKTLFFLYCNTSRGSVICNLIWNLEISVYFIISRLEKLL